MSIFAAWSVRLSQSTTVKFVDRTFVGYGGGISGDVKPGWFGWDKDDFLVPVLGRQRHWAVYQRE